MKWDKIDGAFSGIIMIAILAVIVGTRSQTANVVTAIGKSLSGILGVVVSPVTDNGSAATAAASGLANASTGSAGGGGGGGGGDIGSQIINTAFSSLGGSDLASGLAGNIIDSIGGGGDLGGVISGLFA